MRREAAKDLDSKLPPGFTQMFPETWAPGTRRVRISPVPGEVGRGGHAHPQGQKQGLQEHTRGESLPGDSRLLGLRD